MLRDRRSTHREPRRQLGHPHASPHQAVEDGASCRIGDGVEDVDAGTCSGHGHIRNQLVTQFAASDPSRQAAALYACTPVRRRSPRRMFVSPGLSIMTNTSGLPDIRRRLGDRCAIAPHRDPAHRLVIEHPPVVGNEGGVRDRRVAPADACDVRHRGVASDGHADASNAFSRGPRRSARALARWSQHIAC